jgi:predicted transcriptional regulator
LGQSDVVLEALLDEVQNLKNEISKISNKMNNLQVKVLEIDSRQRERITREEGEVATEIK